MTIDTTPTTPARQRRRLTGIDLALIAAFGALVTVCSIIPGVHVGSSPVPITLQTFAVLLAGAVLGAKRGFLAVLLYLVIGFAGLPVFNGGVGGLGVLARPSAGYIIAFPIAAALCGFIVERLPREKIAKSIPIIFGAGLVSSFLIIHPLGILGLMRGPYDFDAALVIDMGFWPGDVAKNIAMAIVATTVHRSFPDLLPARRK